MNSREAAASALAAVVVAGAIAVSSVSAQAQAKTQAGQPAAAATAKAAPPFEVYALRYATAVGTPVASLAAGADKSRTIDIPFMIWVLKSPGRNVLVDAGSYKGQVFERWKLRDVITPVAAIAKVGLAPADITDIVVTHIHWDHVGGLDLFPRARVWIQRDEFTHYVGNQGTAKDPAITADDAATLWKLHKDGRLSLVDGDAKEILPGVVAYTGGKHTFGSQYVAVRSTAGTIVVASDNIYLYENLEKHVPLGLTADPAADLVLQQRVLELASNPRLVVPGHDPAVFVRFAKPGDGVARIE